MLVASVVAARSAAHEIEHQDELAQDRSFHRSSSVSPASPASPTNPLDHHRSSLEREKEFSMAQQEYELGQLDLEDLSEGECYTDLTTKELIYGVMDGFQVPVEPKYQYLSILAVNVTTVFILLSIAVFAVTTLPHYQHDENSTLPLDVIEAICIGYFVLELGVRVSCAPSQKAFWRSGLTWIDVLSILPYFVMIAVNNSSSDSLGIFRVLRLIRVIRVLKLFKKNAGFDAVFEAFQTSTDALTLMFFMFSIALVSSSACVYFSELDGCTFDQEKSLWIRPDGTISPFQSIFHTFWWCVVTITTIGYGDDVPITPLGKFFASATAIAGVFVISFPTAILGANFAEIHSRKTSEKRMRARELSLRNAQTASDSSRMFRKRRRSSQNVNTENNISKVDTDHEVEQFDDILSAHPVAGLPHRPMDSKSPRRSDKPGRIVSVAGNGGKESISPTAVMTPSPFGGDIAQGASASSFQTTNSTLHGAEMKMQYQLRKEPPRDLFVVESTMESAPGLMEYAVSSVKYGPALSFEVLANSSEAVVVHVEETSMGPYIHFKLLLDEEAIVPAVKKSLASLDLTVSDDKLIAPRRIERLKVFMMPPLGIDTPLLCSEYQRPVGHVRLTIVTQSVEEERKVLQHFKDFKFQFHVTYESDAQFDLAGSCYSTLKLMKLATKDRHEKKDEDE